MTETPPDETVDEGTIGDEIITDTKPKITGERRTESSRHFTSARSS